MYQRIFVVILVSLLISLSGSLTVQAQAPVAGGSPPKLSEKQLEELVGPIALYPDDLVAIILPASTFPLDIVQADRFLEKLKKDPKLQPDPKWDQSVHSLLNYPEVVTKMSRDLDWTQDLGEAVVGQQADVLKAVQAFRAKVTKAGNLKTDDKQIIVQEKETIKIVPANPEVIYVPQYQPSTVVVYQSAPPVAYYPTPYPVYYYPYPPGAAFATGVFFGAATAWACNWHGGHVDYNVNVNRTDNLNVNRSNPQYQQRAEQARAQGQQRADQARAQGQQRADQARAQGQQRTSQAQAQGQQRAEQARSQAQQRAGAQGGGGSQWQSQKRPGEVSGGRPSTLPAGSRPGYGDSGASRGDAFGNAGRGSEAARDSSRGMQSRSGGASTMQGGGARGGGDFSRGSGGAGIGGSGSRPSGGASRGGGVSRGGGGGRGGGRR
jgi:Protein of unknown function (DUF3300)